MGPLTRRIVARARAEGRSVAAELSVPVEHVVVVESGAQPHASVVRSPFTRRALDGGLPVVEISGEARL